MTYKSILTLCLAVNRCEEDEELEGFVPWTIKREGLSG